MEKTKCKQIGKTMNTQVLWDARRALALTQLVVARDVGVDVETYQRWENGWQNPSPANLMRVKIVLGL